MTFSDRNSSDRRPRFVARVAAAGLLVLGATGCIINTSDDDSGGMGPTDDGNPPAETGLPSATTTGTGGNDTDPPATDDGTTGGPMGNCSDNLVVDPGFEGGTPSEAWTEASMVFGTPICDASCTEEPGASPFAGQWWLWLGGVDDEPEVASVSQTITIGPDTAFLSFYFQIRSSGGLGDDMMEVTLDGDTLFMVTDLEMSDYSDYRQVQLDISEWADGGSYELVFRSDHAGTGLSSFFVDQVSLVSCSDEEPTTGDTTVGQDETAGSDETASDSGSGTAGSDSGGSSSGGSSSGGDAGG